MKIWSVIEKGVNGLIADGLLVDNSPLCDKENASYSVLAGVEKCLTRRLILPGIDNREEFFSVELADMALAETLAKYNRRLLIDDTIIKVTESLDRTASEIKTELGVAPAPTADVKGKRKGAFRTPKKLGD
jgi:hypothetical protein